MKKIIYLFLTLSILNSCGDKEDILPTEEEEQQEEVIVYKAIALSATNITVNGFQANWELEDSAETYEVELSTSYNFKDIISTETTLSTIDHFQFTDLKINAVYYYRVKFYIKDQASDYSNIIKVITNRETIKFTVITNDNLTLCGVIDKKITNTGALPLVLFLHEGVSDKSEWTQELIYKMVVDSGYNAAAVDLRGHGESDGTIDWDSFQTDPNILPADLNIILDHLKSQDYIDDTRIAIVGGSLGAILGTGATTYPEIKATVAFTSFYDPVVDLYGNEGINTVFYIAGENDNAEESQNLYDITNEPRKIHIVSGSSAHGVTLISSDDLRNETYNWIKTYL